MLHAYLYDERGHDSEIAIGPSLPRLTRKRLLWLDAISPSPEELLQLQHLLQLSPKNPLEGENNHSRQPLETFTKYIALNFESLMPLNEFAVESPPRSSPVQFLVGKYWLLTVHDIQLPYLKNFRAQDRGQTLIGGLTSAALVSSLLDWHLDTFLSAAEKIERLCDKIDLEILSGLHDQRQVLTEIVSAKRYIGQLLHILGPQRKIFYGLTRADVELTFDKTAVLHLQSLAQRFERTLDVMERTHALTLSSFELQAAYNSQKTNSLLRTLTYVSVLLGIAGAVAGLFGMNFETRLARTGEVGFWAVILALAFVLSALSLFFRWRD